jgi:hypothetical protein
VHLLRRLFADLRSRPKAHLAIALIAVSNHLGVVALAATPTVLAVGTPSLAICGPDAECSMPHQPDDYATLGLPAGARQCHDSGPAAACGTPSSAVAAGTSTTPAGQSACAADAGKVLPTTPAACSSVVLKADAPAGSAGSGGAIVVPSVPIDSLGARIPDKISLSADAEAVRAGNPALLTATANAAVTGTDRAIEIFDLTTGTLTGACGQGSQCSVAYKATAGVHDFAAFVTPPSTSVPDSSIAVASNHVRVGWLNSGISASATVVAPGQPVTVTATSTFDVHESGRWLEIYDLTAGARVTYCSQGTTCATTMKQTGGGVHELVGYVTGKPEAVSAPIYVTWLRASLSATEVGSRNGGWVQLKAIANADLTNTPWVLAIYDQQGHLVDHACKTGTTCVVQAWIDGSTTPTYTAMIGTLPSSRAGVIERISGAVGAAAGQPLVDVQAKSDAIQPTHLLWGVDSCKALIGDATGDLFWATSRKLGTPDFWGRYLTDTVCPAISQREVAIAAAYHMGILPIYNDYDCSAVRYYDTGRGYAASATAAAERLGIPKGRLIAIDIEPPGDACPGAANVDMGFIEGWFDGIKAKGYVPAYYGDGTSGSAFATAWCQTVSRLPNIATDSDLWSFQPSLVGSFNKPSSPGYSPYDTGCAGNMEIWQYVLSAGSNPDVDQDEALSSVPLWFPSSS